MLSLNISSVKMGLVISAASAGKNIKQLEQCVARSTVELPKIQEAIGKRWRRDKYVSISVLCGHHAEPWVGILGSIMVVAQSKNDI